MQNNQVLNTFGLLTPPTPLLLAPGELVKPSGKYSAPTKVPGKNYCKDEVVIRNSDSGKGEFLHISQGSVNLKY